MATHRFVPAHYHTTIGQHEPVLRVASGDAIITTTVDAAGRDATGERVTPPGNPQTGPFYVEGAEPGDALEVRFVRIEPNRDSGWSGTVLAPNVVDPEMTRELPEPESARWRLDRAAGRATLERPATALGERAFALDPMIGCFGVAPAGGQAISTATSGPHGGNMDFRGFRAGSTALLPVAVPGALFHLGDGHALQGDGEIVGTGIEVSCEVEIALRVVKAAGVLWPRGEDGERIFTLGNARPLDQALQHATTEMLRWLQDAYGLDARGASVLLGMCVRYEIGNVFDPAYTVVCALSKAALPPRAG